MISQKCVQSFIDQDSGAVSQITCDALEFWTDSGQVVIPPGFNIRMDSTIKFFLRVAESLGALDLLILHDWQYSTGNGQRGRIDANLRHELIKRTQNNKKSNVGDLWRFLINRIEIEALYIAIRIFFKKKYKKIVLTLEN